MDVVFSEVKRFQVKPDKVEAFEELMRGVMLEQRARPGCLGIRCVKRFYTIDGVESGAPPRKLTKVVKCVQYYAYWVFDTIENFGKASKWLFDEHGKEIMKLLIMPFDIHCGYELAASDDAWGNRCDYPLV